MKNFFAFLLAAILTTQFTVSAYGIELTGDHQKDRVLAVIKNNASSIYNYTHSSADAMAQEVINTRTLTRTQADMLIDLLLNLKEDEYILDGRTIFHLITKKRYLTGEHRDVAQVLFNHAQSGNDLNENIALVELLNTRRIAPEAVSNLTQIFSESRYNNGLNDTNIFIDALGAQDAR